MQNLDLENIDCHATLAITKNTQSGRSMIEMLGVLAIIGVLSVGGIKQLIILRLLPVTCVRSLHHREVMQI